MGEVRYLSNKNQSAAYNVVAGWLGVQIPPPVKHRNRSRAAYRKTSRRRTDAKLRPAA